MYLFRVSLVFLVSVIMLIKKRLAILVLLEVDTGDIGCSIKNRIVLPDD